MDRMAVSSDHCSNPVPPSIVNRDNSDMSEDDEPLSDLACHVCETVCESIFSYTLLLNARIATNSLAKESSLNTFENAKTSLGKVLREQMRQLMLTADPGPGVEGPASAIGHQNFDVIMII